MKESVFMRILFCKIHCPFVCFCKPSAAHLYSPGPLKLENCPHGRQPRNVIPASDTSDQLSIETIEVKEESSDGAQNDQHVLRSCIRKAPNGNDSSKKVEKKKVQWVDNIGRELAEIKEFESIETGDTDTEEENRGCVCIIL